MTQTAPVPTERPQVVVATESFTEIRAEIEALLPAHWAELGEGADTWAMSIDWLLYLRIDANKALHTTTARLTATGALVGYHIAAVRRHPHRELLACDDMVNFVATDVPGRIWVLARMLRHTLETLKTRGVRYFRFRTKMKKNFGFLLERLGFAPTEMIYSLTIHEGQNVGPASDG